MSFSTSSQLFVCLFWVLIVLSMEGEGEGSSKIRVNFLVLFFLVKSNVNFGINTRFIGLDLLFYETLVVIPD